jgi:uncharacterized membrane protein
MSVARRFAEFVADNLNAARHGDEEVPQSRWQPQTRLLAGVAGGSLLLLGLMRRGKLVGAVGAGLVVSAMLNKPVWQLLGIGAGRRAVDLKKTLIVDAPVAEVFELWRNYQSFPLFMEHVRAVLSADGRESHWEVVGPAGFSIEWDAELTVCVPNKRLGWKTLPGQFIEHAGTVAFTEVLDGKTRLDIQISYNPPAGVLGHLVAVLFDVDPQTALDADLEHFKAMLETRQEKKSAPPNGLDSVDESLWESFPASDPPAHRN